MSAHTRCGNVVCVRALKYATYIHLVLKTTFGYIFCMGCLLKKHHSFAVLFKHMHTRGIIKYNYGLGSGSGSE